MKRHTSKLRHWTLVLIAAAPLSVLGCSAFDVGGGEGAPHPVLDALFQDGRTTPTIAHLIDLAELADDQRFKVVDVGRDDASSHHVVAIRDREAPHRHDTHDLVVVILKGYGTMRIGNEDRPVGEGSILYVPRATVHAFRNLSSEPAVAYAVYFPPYDSKNPDKILVETPPGP